MQSHWAKLTVETLVDLGVINGYTDGTFKPNNTITRSEFAKLVRTALKLELLTGNSFNDTAKNWAKSEIHTLVVNGGISKSEYGENFYPNKNITRLEMAKIIVRAVGLNDKAIEKTGNTTQFTDDNLIATADKGYIIIASENKIINGLPDKRFNPNGEATRAEASQMIVNMLNYLKNVEEIPTEPVPTPTPVPNPTPTPVDKQAEMEQRILDGTFTFEDVEWKRQIEKKKQAEDSNYIMQPIFKTYYNPTAKVYCYIYILNGDDYAEGTEIKKEYTSHTYLNTSYSLTPTGLKKNDVTLWADMWGSDIGMNIGEETYYGVCLLSQITKEYRCPEEIKGTIDEIKVGETLKLKITLKRNSNSKEYIINTTIR
jgi:hypothetical protein